MLTDERIWELWREAQEVHTVETDMTFARMIEQEAARQERERCIEIVMGERVDFEATQSDQDEAYNLALVHAADAIREGREHG